MSQVPIGKPFQGLKIKLGKQKELSIGGKIISPGYLDNSGKLNKGKFLLITLTQKTFKFTRGHGVF